MIIVFILFSIYYTQNLNLALSFSGADSLSNIQLDSVKVINRSQGGESMIYWPDTTISIVSFANWW